MKSEHQLDFTEGTAERLLHQIVYHAMPPTILDEFRNVLSKSFPTFKEYFDNMHIVVNKLQDKAECMEKSKPTPKQNLVLSTIPENAINIVKSHNKKDDKVKACIFCGITGHRPSVCPHYVTVESRCKIYNKKIKDCWL